MQTRKHACFILSTRNVAFVYIGTELLEGCAFVQFSVQTIDQIIGYSFQGIFTLVDAVGDILRLYNVSIWVKAVI